MKKILLLFIPVVALMLSSGCPKVAKIQLSTVYITPTPEPTEPICVVIDVPYVEPSEVVVSGHPDWKEGQLVPKWFDCEESDRDLIIWELVHNGLSLSAACGVTANIVYESACEPCIWSNDGSYGLCQWLGSRINQMVYWCEENDLDSDSVEGQVAFLVYDLERYGVDLEQSAYNVAFDMCVYYERPANTYYQAVVRGEYAMELETEKIN